MKSEQVKAYLTPREKAEVTALAGQARITTSELVRRTTLGRTLPNTRLHESVIELARINADLARLGNLYRMALVDDDDGILPQGFNLQDLYEDIRDMQTALKTKIKDL